MENFQVAQILLKMLCSSLLLAFTTISQAQSASSDGEGGQLFGDWVVHCQTETNKLVFCKMSQMAVVGESQEPLLRINIRYLPNTAESAIQFVLPLGISLHNNPLLKLDQAPATEVALDLCLPDGCYSTSPLSAKLLEQFLSMKTGSLKVYAGNGEAADIPISGTGSRAAFRAMRTKAEQLAKRQAGSVK